MREYLIKLLGGYTKVDMWLHCQEATDNFNDMVLKPALKREQNAANANPFVFHLTTTGKAMHNGDTYIRLTKRNPKTGRFEKCI